MSKFKIFVGEMASPGTLPKDLLRDLRSFTKGKSVDPKSIGVEFLESTNELMVSLGYQERKSRVVADFKLKRICNVSEDRDAIASGLEKATARMKGLICHEIFVDSGGDVHAIFMVGR